MPLMDIAAAAIRSRFRGGFLHIPYVPEQAARVGGAPSMALDDIVRGIEIILAVSAERTDRPPHGRRPDFLRIVALPGLERPADRLGVHRRQA